VLNGGLCRSRITGRMLCPSSNRAENCVIRNTHQAGGPLKPSFGLSGAVLGAASPFSRSVRKGGRETLNPAPYRRRPVFSLTPRLDGNNIEQSIICEVMPLFDNQTNGTAPNRTGDASSRKAAEECSPQRKLWVRKRESRSPGRGERTAMAARTQSYKFQNETVDPP
jgi:hypothetical protein